MGTMRPWLFTLWLVLLAAAFAAGLYLRTPEAPPPQEPARVPEATPDLYALTRAGEFEATLALVGSEGWSILAAALEGLPAASERAGFLAFEARFGASAANHLAIADTLLEDRRFLAAVDRIYEADRLGETPEPADQLLTRLVDGLQSGAVSDAAILEVLEGITLAFPEKARFQLLLGELMLAAGDPLGADGVLAQIVNHPRFGARARLLRAGDAPLPGGVPLERVGNQFYVDASIDDATEVTLMVDTGAAMTVLSSELLAVLGYDLAAAPKRYFSTAGGVVRAPVVRIDSFELGGRRLRDFPVGAIDMPLSADAAGLLGMDFLSRHPFAIDQERSVLILGPNAREDL